MMIFTKTTDARRRIFLFHPCFKRYPMSLTDNSKESTLSTAPGLTVTATPIGNLGDLSPRARESLEKADIIACEDTRHTGLMLSRLGIAHGKLVAYHDHSPAATTTRLITAMADGKAVTLVSDAGTPLISDPGFRLVRGCREHGIAVTTIPGPSALLAGLAVAGLPTDRFFFGGFLPTAKGQRRKELEAMLPLTATLVFYESPKRITATLADLAELAPDREIAIAREMTKLHEECLHGQAAILLARYQDSGPPKGEIVLMIGPASAAAMPDEADLLQMLRRAIADGYSRRDAADLVSTATGAPRRKVYSLSLELDNIDR